MKIAAWNVRASPSRTPGVGRPTILTFVATLYRRRNATDLVLVATPSFGFRVATVDRALFRLNLQEEAPIACDDIAGHPHAPNHQCGVVVVVNALVPLSSLQRID